MQRRVDSGVVDENVDFLRGKSLKRFLHDRLSAIQGIEILLDEYGAAAKLPDLGGHLFSQGRALVAAVYKCNLGTSFCKLDGYACADTPRCASDDGGLI